jgi:hypothetical protein
MNDMNTMYLCAGDKGGTGKHNGYPFCNNENAVLVATGITHHIVLLLKK